MVGTGRRDVLEVNEREDVDTWEPLSGNSATAVPNEALRPEIDEDEIDFESKQDKFYWAKMILQPTIGIRIIERTPSRG